MKKLLFAAFAGICALSSCKKDDTVEQGRLETIPRARLLVPNMNEECKRLADMCTGYQEAVGINYGLTFGMVDREDPSMDCWLTGATTNTGIRVWLNGTPFQAEANGQWFERGSVLTPYFGQNVAVKISNGQNAIERTIYVPAAIRVTGLYDTARNGRLNLVYRTGNKLHWTPDPQSTTGKVAISYKMHNGYGSSGQTVAEDIVIVDDNGIFDMDPYITSSTTAFDVSFWRGNAVAFQDGGRKIRFSIASSDSHFYTILD